MTTESSNSSTLHGQRHFNITDHLLHVAQLTLSRQMLLNMFLCILCSADRPTGHFEGRAHSRCLPRQLCRRTGGCPAGHQGRAGSATQCCSTGAFWTQSSGTASLLASPNPLILNLLSPILSGASLFCRQSQLYSSQFCSN